MVFSIIQKYKRWSELPVHFVMLLNGSFYKYYNLAITSKAYIIQTDADKCYMPKQNAFGISHLDVKRQLLD